MCPPGFYFPDTIFLNVFCCPFSFKQGHQPARPHGWPLSQTARLGTGMPAQGAHSGWRSLNLRVPCLGRCVQTAVGARPSRLLTARRTLHSAHLHAGHQPLPLRVSRCHTWASARDSGSWATPASVFSLLSPPAPPPPLHLLFLLPPHSARTCAVPRHLDRRFVGKVQSLQLPGVVPWPR